MKNAFDTVLIDEAAQASEVAVLQPLSFGCKRCVAKRAGSNTQDYLPRIHLTRSSRSSPHTSARGVPSRMFVCRRLVLVGDPQQLPATIKSQVSRASSSAVVLSGYRRQHSAAAD